MVKGSTLTAAEETVQVQLTGGLPWAGSATESHLSGTQRCPCPSAQLPFTWLQRTPSAPAWLLSHDSGQSSNHQWNTQELHLCHPLLGSKSVALVSPHPKSRVSARQGGSSWGSSCRALCCPAWAALLQTLVPRRPGNTTD